MKNELRSRWDYFCGKLWAKNRAVVFASLDTHYSEEHRHYHNWKHILDCLRKLDKYSEATGRLDLFTEGAIWFHDVIYDTQQHDNEEKSARFFDDSWKVMDTQYAAYRSGVGEGISDFITNTKTHPLTCLTSGQVLFDIDLSILGADDEYFDEYDEQIRAEYIWVPDDIFGAGRVGVLAGFLQREKIYQTEHFSKLEDQARRNLKRAIDKYSRPK